MWARTRAVVLREIRGHTSVRAPDYLSVMLNQRSAYFVLVITSSVIKCEISCAVLNVRAIYLCNDKKPDDIPDHQLSVDLLINATNEPREKGGGGERGETGSSSRREHNREMSEEMDKSDWGNPNLRYFCFAAMRERREARYRNICPRVKSESCAPLMRGVRIAM